MTEPVSAAAAAAAAAAVVAATAIAAAASFSFLILLVPSLPRPSIQSPLVHSLQVTQAWEHSCHAGGPGMSIPA